MAAEDCNALRRCTRCGVEKPATREHFSIMRMPKKNWEGLSGRCKPCLCAVAKERMQDPAARLRRKLYKREQYLANPEKFREEKRSWAAKNPELRAAQKKREYAKNAEEQKRKALEWQRANPERANARKRAYKKSEKGRANMNKPANRLRGNCSLAIRRFLKGKKSNKPWTTLVDYTMPELVAHLERQFTKGMTWENYGEWHVDHIIPLASFEISNDGGDDFDRAFALANLRPLWAKDNQSKHAQVLTLL